MTHLEQLGEDQLRLILTDFYDRVFADVMVGFFFSGQDKGRLIQLEYELTARHLGGGTPYTGRNLREAHASHPIRRGHFQRRNVLLADTLRDHDVPPEIFEAWMATAYALEAAVLGDGGDCG